MSGDLFIGIDVGTSGARAVIIDEARRVVAQGAKKFADKKQARSPRFWWDAVRDCLGQALSGTQRRQVRAICVSATSGTILALDQTDEPLPQVYMYNDPCPDAQILANIRQHAPDWSPARGQTGGLACILALQKRMPARIGHQADWINFQLTGRWLGDASSALKSGYDPFEEKWPDWIEDLGLNRDILSKIFAVGDTFGTLAPAIAEEFGLPVETRIVAGTTDGCASFLATGANCKGDGVTALGTTMTIKLLSKRPVFAPEYGVYSHRIGDHWLVGGASNTGGGVLLKYFSAEQLGSLSAQIDPQTASGLDYYPLPAIGERFPVSDPSFAGLDQPRPASDVKFLHGLLEGIANVEARSYARLSELGAPPPRRIFSVGGGSKNPIWSSIRSQKLGIDFEQPKSVEAAYGSAMLAIKSEGMLVPKTR